MLCPSCGADVGEDVVELCPQCQTSISKRKMPRAPGTAGEPVFPAALSSRVLAAIFDTCLLYLVYCILWSVFSSKLDGTLLGEFRYFLLESAEYSEFTDPTLRSINSLALSLTSSLFYCFVLGVVITTLLESSDRNTTPGKFLLQLRVQQYYGRIQGVRRLLIKNLCKLLYFIPIIISFFAFEGATEDPVVSRFVIRCMYASLTLLVLGHACLLTSANRQTFHELVTACFVVQASPEKPKRFWMLLTAAVLLLGTIIGYANDPGFLMSLLTEPRETFANWLYALGDAIGGSRLR